MKTKALDRKIASYYRLGAKIKEKTIEYIKDFIGRRGKDGKFVIDVDVNELIDPVYILVETDRHTGDMGYENIDDITVKGNDIIIGTESNNTYGTQLGVTDLIEIYDYLHYMDDESNWDDVEIIEGELVAKESDDEEDE